MLINNAKQFLAIVALGLMAATQPSHATLVGDTVTINHVFPDANTTYTGYTVYTNHLVTDDATDTVTLGNNYKVNVQAESVLVNFINAATWAGTSFNGLSVSDLDWTGSTITGFTVDTNLVGWTDSRLSYANKALMFNWQSLSFNTSSYFNVYIQSASVPEASSLALLGLGLLMVGVRKQKRQ